MDLEGYSKEQPVTVVVYPEEDEYPREDESAADGKVTVQLPVNGHHAVVGVEDGTSSNVVVVWTTSLHQPSRQPQKSIKGFTP